MVKFWHSPVIGRVTAADWSPTTEPISTSFLEEMSNRTPLAFWVFG